MEVYEPQEDSFLLKNSILKEKLSGKSCLDLGAGSGIQARAMFDAGSLNIVSSDINYKALLKSQQNNSDIKENITFIESNLFKSIHNKFDFIAFNPPYLPSKEMKWKDLDGGKEGKEVINSFIEQFPSFVNKNFVVLLLISSLNGKDEIISEIEKKGFFVEIVANKKLFFEELYVLRITNNEQFGLEEI